MDFLYEKKNLLHFHSSLTDGGELKKRLERIALKYGATVEQVRLLQN